jgi:lipopolysaccharide biosynthesis regulator YciM
LDNILPAYDDPLFSILVIVLLVLIVAVSSFVMGNIKEERKEKSLKRFLNRFNTKESLLEIEEMPFEKTLIKPLSLLALAFKNQGEYQKSINLNLYLIEHIPNFHDKEEILEQLGQTYLKAGFLKRSESIFLEILHKHARNKETLYHLGIVYELLNEYDKAVETLNPLRILGEETEQLEAHLKLSKILTNKELSNNEKVKYLQNLLKSKNHEYRRIIKALFQLDLEIAWKSLEGRDVVSILDILWFLPSSNLNFDIISSDKTLTLIFLAKGILPLNKPSTEKSNIFAIDTIISAKKGGNHELDMNFNYGCSKCKGHFPITFTRCPQCYAIDSIQLKETLAKKRSQTGYSLL